MIYRSNLSCPDLSDNFKHLHVRTLPNSMGHDVPSDWVEKSPDDPLFGIYRKCGMITHDEAAILYNIAKLLPGYWLDIGSHTGWSSSYIAAGGGSVIGIDPMYQVDEFLIRAVENIRPWTDITFNNKTSCEFFKDFDKRDVIDCVMIDGDHAPGEPEFDAEAAAQCEACMIVFHDFIGGPVRNAARLLMDKGFNCRVYNTPFFMAACWLGSKFTPPDHVADPSIDWGKLRAEMTDFPFERCV